MKLKWIEIKNFRGIRHALLKDFTDINIFIGKNNTGKSTILEAISLVKSRFKFDYFGTLMFIRIFNKRGWDEKRFVDIVEEIKYKHIYSPEINIEGENFSLDTINIPIKVVEELKGRKPNINTDAGIGISVDRNGEWFCTNYIWVDKEMKLLDSFIYYSDKEEIRKEFEDIIENVMLIDESLLRDLSVSAKAFEKLIDIEGYKAKKSILEGLRYYYPDIVDLDIKENILRIIFEDYAITFPSIADGLKSSLILSIVIYIMEDGIICIEEPENHLHPALQNLYIEYIIRSVREKNNQIFISTHSLEFLEKLLEYAKTRDINLNIYKLIELKNGELNYKRYSLEDAYEAINEIGIDLR